MTEPVAAKGPNNRLPLILGLGAAAILVLLLVNVLGGGGDEAEEEGATTTTVQRVATTTTTAAPGEAPTETFEVFTTKNPFLPLRSTAAAGSAGGGATGSTGATTGATGSTGGSSGGARGGTTATTIRGGTTATTTRSGGSSGTSSGGSVEPRRSDRVALIDVFAEGGRVVANVRVNDTVHKVSEGETFAGNYRALSLSQADDCGRFMFGDDTFRLCRGEETLK